MDRGYTSASYERLEYLTDLPGEYAFFNEYDHVSISQNSEHKELFDLCFSKKFDVMEVPEEEWPNYWKEIQMDKKEREKFELYLISNLKKRLGAVPQSRNGHLMTVPTTILSRNIAQMTQAI